jgi:predicted permease
MWIALRASWPNLAESRDVRVFRGLARLQPGVTPQQATARLTQIAQHSLALQPVGAARLGISTTVIQDEMLGSARAAIEILFAAVLLVLLIACANAANLLLANANARSGELAVRVALGAGRSRVARLLFAETICLGLASGVLGMALAVFATKAIARFAPADIPGVASAQIDFPALGVGLLLTFATILIFGLGPAWLASKRDPNEALKSTWHRASGTAAQISLRRLLIVSEVAFAAFLLVGAGLLVRSYSKLAAVDPGFRADHILTFRVTTEKPDQPSRRILYKRILEGLRTLPGVESAAAVLIRPLSGAVGWDTSYVVQGQSEIESRSNPNGNYEAISPAYFHTMGIRLISGRDFTDADNATSAPVVIVNETTARRHWPAGSAIGKQIRLASGPRPQWATVAGVVRDVRYREWEAARPDFYVPLLQRAQHRTDFVVKTRVPPAELAEAARRLVLSIDSTQPIGNVTTMAALADSAIARSRFNGVMLGSLAACAVLLAAFGIYSLLSYIVSQSAFEIALRTALGAMPGDVAGLIAGRGVVLVAAGCMLGLGAALAANRFLASLLYELSPADPITYLATFGVLIFIALAASARPAVRAVAIDPMQTLRSGG